MQAYQQPRLEPGHGADREKRGAGHAAADEEIVDAEQAEVGGAKKVGDASAGDARQADSRAGFAERGGSRDRGDSPASGRGPHTIEEAEPGHRMVQRGGEVQSFNRQLQCSRSPTIQWMLNQVLCSDAGGRAGATPLSNRASISASCRLSRADSSGPSAASAALASSAAHSISER